jgi:hypothetical protein
VGQPGRARRFLLLTLIGFVCAFGFIRLSTRLMRSPRVPWWPGSVVSEGGVHVHHLFFGIVLMMVAGGLSFAVGETDGPWYAIYAVLFGIGLGLAIDEYALWLHLDDVYWSRAGRSSIDATLIALGLFGLVLLAFVPTRIDDDSPAVLATTVAAATWHFGWVLIAASKYRLVHALFGIFVPLLAVYAGLRLAKPRSVWAKRFYGERNPGQTGARRAAVPRRPPDRSVQGAPARRDRRGHGGGVPGATGRGWTDLRVNHSPVRAEALGPSTRSWASRLTNVEHRGDYSPRNFHFAAAGSNPPAVSCPGHQDRVDRLAPGAVQGPSTQSHGRKYAQHAEGAGNGRQHGSACLRNRSGGYRHNDL